MARPKGSKNKSKPTHATEAVKRPSSEDVQNAVAEVARQRASVAEYTGLAGKATALFCDRWNINKHAFSFTRKLAAMDDQKRQSVLVDLADMCRAMDFTDQADWLVDVPGAVDSLKGGGPDPDDVAARTEADLAETPKFLKGKHADRVASEVDDAVGGLN